MESSRKAHCRVHGNHPQGWIRLHADLTPNPRLPSRCSLISNLIKAIYSATGNELFTPTGSVFGTSISATASEGTTITVTLDKTTVAHSGSWVDAAQGLSDTYFVSGCKVS